MSPTDSTPTPGAGTPSTSTQTAHKHAVSDADRAVVVGKCLTPVAEDRPHQVIEVLVDIAG